MKQLSLVAALFNQNEVEAEPTVLDRWPTAYIIDNHGHIFLHRKLGAGGHVTLKAKDRPERLKDIGTTFSECINHLPGGKIPLDLFSQVCSFFKKVMKDKGYDKSTNMSAATGWRSSNEAMAHILWNNDTKKYEIGIPTQKVSTAAVDFSYDDVKENHVIVIDVHSHNNMGAFWSQRDDKEDAKGIWYSGVVGTIDKGPTTNWRFSMNGEFRSVKFEDIYDGTFDQVQFDLEVPDAWMDKVSQYTYSSTSLPARHWQDSGYQNKGTGARSWHRGDTDDLLYEEWWKESGFGTAYTQSIASRGTGNYADITFTELRDEMRYHLEEVARLGHAASILNLYRPRISINKQDLGQALFTILESFSDENLDVLFAALEKTMVSHRRSKAAKYKSRKTFRSMDIAIERSCDVDYKPSHISR